MMSVPLSPDPRLISTLQAQKIGQFLLEGLRIGVLVARAGACRRSIASFAKP